MNKPNSKKKEYSLGNGDNKKPKLSPEQPANEDQIGLPEVDMKKFMGCGG